jgi:hypothetical protein
MAGKLRIGELTDEHRASFDVWRERWTAIGRSTDETDEATAVRAVHLAWAAAGFAAPHVVFARSPIEALHIRDKWDDNAPLPERPTGAPAWASDPGWRPDSGWSRNMLYGCQDAGWLSYYDWFAHHGLSDICRPLEGLILLAQSAGWTLAYEHVAIVSDRPCILRDEGWRRRLHCDDGPSVAYRDGWELYHWHGQLVPQWVILDPTPARIEAEPNTEIRRCAIESYGWDRYVVDIDAALVDEADDPGNPGHTLRLYDVPPERQPYDEPTRVLVMANASRDRDGSRRQFAETVPASIGSAVEAAAWQFDVPADIYRSLERAT